MHVTVLNHHETVIRDVNVQNLAIDKESRCKSILIPWINFLTLDLNDLVARPSLNCRCLAIGAKTDARDGSEPSRDCDKRCKCANSCH